MRGKPRWRRQRRCTRSARSWRKRRSRNRRTPNSPKGTDVELRHVTYLSGASSRRSQDVSFVCPRKNRGRWSARPAEKDHCRQPDPAFWDAQEGGAGGRRRCAADHDGSSLMDKVALCSGYPSVQNEHSGKYPRRARPDATREEALRCAATCAGHGRYPWKKEPQGIDTVIGTKGVVHLSGEQQRIALARAI